MANGYKDSIGMSWHPKGYKSDPDYYGGDKYDTILQDLNLYGPKAIDPLKEYKKRKNERDNEILRGIANMNFMVIWQERHKIRNAGAGITCFAIFGSCQSSTDKMEKSKSSKSAGKCAKIVAENIL